MKTMKRTFLFLAVLSLACASCARLRVAEVKFNHDTTSSANDALNIRKNFGTAITVPEWTNGQTDPTNSPAAFVGGRTVIVMAKLTAKRDGNYTCYTKGGPFQLKKTQVHIQNGVSNPTWVPFDSTYIPPSVKVSNVKWKWKKKLCWILNCPFARSYHRFYILTELPKEPWTQTPFPDNQNPWTEALDYACAWADGQTAKIGIQTKVTEQINNGPYAYDQNAGATHYGTFSPRQYDLTAFLDRLKGGLGNGSVVNCTDCGMSVTAFANILGCELWSSRMGWGFDLNPIVAVGYSSFACPNWGCSFSYHEVAWTGNALANEPIYDACLKVDGDADPVNPPHAALLPINILFDDPSGLDYHERLVPPSSLSSCQAQPSTKVRPPVY